MQKDEKTLEIVYDGQPVSLSEEEAVTFAQKGMNYDRLFEKYDQAVNALDELAAYKEKIDLLSEKTGATPEKILKLLDESVLNAEVYDLSEEEQIPEQYARKMMEMKAEIESLQKEKDALIPIKKRQEDMDAFMREYPEIDIKDIDKEIIDEWHNSGKSLVDVYNSSMVKRLLREKKADSENEKNRSASCGSVSGTNSAERKYSYEDIKNMSEAEISKNFKYLVKQLRKDENNG